MSGRNAERSTVVGAGPAGLVAALTLAQAGHPVRVLERHPSVGHRFHGDMQGLENWSGEDDTLHRLRELGIKTSFPWRGFDEVTFYDSRLRPFTTRTKRPLFYLVRRGSGADTLDTSLLEQARDAGAEVRLGEAAREASPGTIVATGPQRADGIAAGYVFHTSLQDQAHAIVHPALAPGGYAYLLIWNGSATLATCVFRGLPTWQASLEATVAAFTRLVPGLQLDQPRRFGGYGALLARTRYTDEAGRVYAGEAAGLQDAEWGFGMMTAMRSGALAANSQLGGYDYGPLASREFEPARAAGLTNRAFSERLPQRLLDRAVRHEAGRADLGARLRRHWAPNPVKSLLAPHLLSGYADRLRDLDRACHDASCRCLRCTCGNLLEHEQKPVGR